MLTLGCAASLLLQAQGSEDSAISLNRITVRPVPVVELPAAEVQAPMVAETAISLAGMKTSSVLYPEVPPVPSIEEVRAARAAVQPLPGVVTVASAVDDAAVAGRMSVNDVLLTSGENELTGVVNIPSLLPVPDEGVDQTGARRKAEELGYPNVQAYREQRRMERRSRPPSKIGMGFRKLIGHFVEFEDPIEFDVDDYDMPVLLVAAQEEIPDDDKDSNDDSEGEDAPRKLLSRKLTDIRPTLAYAWGSEDRTDLPEDFHKRMDNGIYEEVVPPRMVLQWAPTNLWYYPLYFEDPGLERYGHTRRDCIQPFVSSGRFLGQIAGLPYQMVLHPPKCPEYALGYYQPGEWAPKKKYQIPFNEEAAATEFLWITALILIIP
ncbi:MAG: hypothetical protein R3C49_16035 [Planctomycetaceae bacterium]